jgi:diguanylate cyclase (GGDEF)-like protein
LSLVAVCVVVLLSSQQLGARVSLAGDAAIDETLFLRLQYRAAQEQLALAGFRMDGDVRDLDAFRSAADDVEDFITQAAALDAGEGGDGSDDTEMLANLARLHTEYRRDAEELVASLQGGGTVTAAVTSRLELRERTFLAELDATEDEHGAATAEALNAARGDGELVRIGTPIAMLLTLMLLGALWVLARAQQRAARRQALHDTLTGLPNRALFGDRAGQAVAAAERSGAVPAVLMLDLDRFKEVNDTLGHQAGDALLQQVADRLRGIVRAGDTVARFGGDEFAVLLSSGGRNVATEVAARITATVERPFTLDGVSVGVEASVGIATFDGGLPGTELDRLVEDLVRQADTAMHVAKAERCGVSHYATGEDGDEVADRLSLLSELREALDHGQLVLHYQPQVSTRDGALSGIEALVRWQHPVRGMVPPDVFIPLAENTTLIHRLTDIVVTQALGVTRALLDGGLRVPVSVNVSARTLLDRGFPGRVADQLRAAGVPADLLTVEITESAIMLDPDRALEVLHELRGMGVRLSVDDFGTGYSSMAYLKLLPVGELKIDRSFVRHMAVDREDAVLVRSAVDLGHSLGLSVVAEGVEDGATLDALTELGADDVQGYHLARPMPEEALRHWVAGRPAPQPAPPSASIMHGS